MSIIFWFIRQKALNVWNRSVERQTPNSKDKLSWQECAEILATAFSVQSNVYVNRDYSEQTIVLNAVRRINVAGAGFFAMAIVDVSENNLAPVTAYHATEAKCKAIQRGW